MVSGVDRDTRINSEEAGKFQIILTPVFMTESFAKFSFRGHKAYIVMVPIIETIGGTFPIPPPRSSRQGTSLKLKPRSNRFKL